MHDPWFHHAERAFAALLERIGVWAIYTRADIRFRCRDCYDLVTNDSPPNCALCFGTGYRVRLERWLIYPADALTRLKSLSPDLTDIGWTDERSPVVFTRAVDEPRVGDIFFLVGWNCSRDEISTRQCQPIRIDRAFRVTYVAPQYIGDVNYYAAHCEEVTEARSQFQTALLSTPVQVTRT